MRVFSISPDSLQESAELPDQLAGKGYLWISCTRQEFGDRLAELHATIHRLTGLQLVDLHVSDLLNHQLPSHFDYTSQYDLLVFRRLASVKGNDPAMTGLPNASPSILHQFDTSPVGFAVFEQVLLSVHPADCTVRDAYAARLLLAASGDPRAAAGRLPTSPADLMLRFVNLMVDGFLELRRELTRQLDRWQTALIDPRARFYNWAALLETRLALHQLDEICEDQRSAILDWIEALEDWPEAGTPLDQRERDLLQVRSRDVLEHIERVVHHVRRLEQSVETAVQIHFNAQSNRTNDIMRTLTVLTAIFLPLNLIAGIFGMNFDFIPLIHSNVGFWLTMASMGLIAVVLAVYFWRKRYLEHAGQ